MAGRSHLVVEEGRPRHLKLPHRVRALGGDVRGGGGGLHGDGEHGAAEVAHARVDLAKVAEVVLAQQPARALGHRGDVQRAPREKVLVRAMRGGEARREGLVGRAPAEHADVGRQRLIQLLAVVDLVGGGGLGARGCRRRQHADALAQVGAHAEREHLAERAHALVGAAAAGHAARRTVRDQPQLHQRVQQAALDGVGRLGLVGKALVRGAHVCDAQRHVPLRVLRHVEWPFRPLLL